MSLFPPYRQKVRCEHCDGAAWTGDQIAVKCPHCDMLGYRPETDAERSERLYAEQEASSGPDTQFARTKAERARQEGDE